MINKRANSGFTLIELLVSIAIFSLMTVVAYAGIAAVMNNDQTSFEHETALKRLQRTFVFIEKDLRQISPRQRNPGISDLLPALRSGEGEDVGLLEFSRAGHSNPTELTRSSLQRVRYVFVDEELQRWSWNLVDHSDIEPSKMVLLKDVTAASVAFFSEEGETVDEWTSDALPLGIEIRLTTERWGELRRVLPIYY
ncbi:type II secretion system minor pseudopilin GspJ [Leucothrix mucor]|jgi:general secretion pathway protein J|uniref:type II secretion system minor pseudopilin GspJ n=1 Tax=Leucothrix mucor TaxID=45248 RepID=UPI0003B5DBCC|nr:type II secretion system minor pseudopilin GspJ [Leucothrix mucor]